MTPTRCGSGCTTYLLHTRIQSGPPRKAPTVYTTAQHGDERYQILTKRVKAHFLPLKKEPDLREKLETFFRGVVQELLPNATVEVREQ